MKIVKYDSNKDIIVEFQDKFKARVHTGYHCFKNGGVINPYYPTVRGIGYLGEGENVRVGGKLVESYKVWFSMLDRCYGNNSIKNPSYKDCTVCEEWHNYRNFNKWYQENFYQIKDEVMELDKDILFKHNKIYSPEKCCFVPSCINCLFTKSDKARGDYPIGVMWHNRDHVFEAWCSNGHKKQIYLGRFNNENDAFITYKNHKEWLIKKVAEKYKNNIPQKLYIALVNYNVEITD